MRELCRVLERRDIPIQMSQPLMDVWVSGSDVPDIRFKVLHVHYVESHDCGVEPNVRLRNVLSKIVGSFGFGEVLLNSIQGIEELHNRFCVSFFCCSEAGAVDAVVDVGICPFVRGFDFFLKVLGIEDDVLVFLWEEVVEL